MLDSGLIDVAQEALRKAHSYIEQSQVSCNETSALIQSAIGSFELPLLLGGFNPELHHTVLEPSCLTSMVQSWYGHGTVMVQSWSMLRFDGYDRLLRTAAAHHSAPQHACRSVAVR